MSTDNTLFDGLNLALFASYSPYSPLNLRHLPQPVPSDAQTTREQNIFTYEDAFEDLLAVSVGRPMMDLQSRSSMRKLLNQMFPTGEPASFWIQRLDSQGLLKSPLLSRDLVEFTGPISWRGQLQDEFSASARGRWQIGGDSSDQSTEDHNGKFIPGLFSQLDRLFRHFDPRPESGKPRHLEGPRESSESQPYPDSYEDMYRTWESAFSEGQRSLSSLISLLKDASNDFHTPPQPSSYPSQGPAGNQVESTEEYTDDAGNFHTKKTVRTLDENGREIARQTEYTVRSKGILGPDDAKDDSKLADKTGQKDDTTTKKLSWYWK